MNWNSLNDDSDVKVQSRQPAQISTTFMSPKVSFYCSLKKNRQSINRIGWIVESGWKVAPWVAQDLVTCEHRIGQLHVSVHGVVLLHTGSFFLDTRSRKSTGGQPGGGLSQLQKFAHPKSGRLHTSYCRHHRLHMCFF